jgi:hypothetical protein
MPSILAECTKCGGEKVGFQWVAEHRVPAPGRPEQWYVTFICGNCQAGLMVLFARAQASNYNSPGNCPRDPSQEGFLLIERYPEPKPSKAPDHVPDGIAVYFIEASDGLKRAAHTSSGMMSRKVIDVSTKRQLGKESGKYRDNRNRIDALADSGAITRDLQDWAHHVRLGGNDAAHDDDPFTKEEAEDLLSFTELYLTYVYSLPGRLRVRRGLPPFEPDAERPPEPA